MGLGCRWGLDYSIERERERWGPQTWWWQFDDDVPGGDSGGEGPWVGGALGGVLTKTSSLSDTQFFEKKNCTFFFPFLLKFWN